MDVHGIGPAGAARILADVGDVARFPDRAHFASWTGTALLDASSGEHLRHRLSRAGNRRLNHVLYHIEGSHERAKAQAFLGLRSLRISWMLVNAEPVQVSLAPSS
jgi:transposase